MRQQLVTGLVNSLLPMQPRFQSNIPSKNLVSNEIYHRIDGILLSSSKYGKGPLVVKNKLGANQKRRNIFNE